MKVEIKDQPYGHEEPKITVHLEYAGLDIVDIVLELEGMRRRVGRISRIGFTHEKYMDALNLREFIRNGTDA